MSSRTIKTLMEGKILKMKEYKNGNRNKQNKVLGQMRTTIRTKSYYRRTNIYRR
jgi:hypothetical protein